MQGADIMTVEGLSETEINSILQRWLREGDAVQCGFCTPGFLMGTMRCCSRTRIHAATRSRGRQRQPVPLRLYPDRQPSKRRAGRSPAAEADRSPKQPPPQATGLRRLSLPSEGAARAPGCAARRAPALLQRLPGGQRSSTALSVSFAQRADVAAEEHALRIDKRRHRD